MTREGARPLSRSVSRIPRLAVAVLLITAAAAQAGTASLDAQQVGIATGSVPEAVELEDLDGTPVDLGAYIGRRPVLVQFWATWCEVCAALEPRLRAAAARWEDDVDFVLVAVGVNQNPRRIRRYMDDHPLHGTVLWDGRGRATRAFMAPTTGYLVILDARGRVVYTGVGADQAFEPALAEVAAP